MKFWLGLLLALLAISSAQTSSNSTDLADEDDDSEVDFIAEGELTQAESIFAFEAAERAADRTTDDLRALDVNVNGLLAVQAAIYAILIDRLDDFAPAIRYAFICAIALATLNLFLGRGKSVPRPVEFNEALNEDVEEARSTVIAVLLKRTVKNDAMLLWKRRLFRLALALTVIAAIVAPFVPVHQTDGSATGSSTPPASVGTKVPGVVK